MRHVVVHVEVGITQRVEQPDPRAADQMQRLVVEKLRALAQQPMPARKIGRRIRTAQTSLRVPAAACHSRVKEPSRRKKGPQGSRSGHGGVIEHPRPTGS